MENGFVLVLRMSLNASRIVRLALVLAAAGYAGLAGAAGYRMIQGQGYTVCEAFAPYLADRTERNPMVCQIDLGGDPDGFSRPHWQELSLAKAANLALFRKLDQIARQYDRSFANGGEYGKFVSKLNREEWQKDFRWRKKQPYIGKPRLLKAKLGLDGKGSDETVVATTWGTGECRRYVASGIATFGSQQIEGPYSLFLYDEKTGKANLDATGGQPISNVAFRGMDPLIFQGRAFLFTTYYSPGVEAAVLIAPYYAKYGAAVSRCQFDMKLLQQKNK